MTEAAEEQVDALQSTTEGDTVKSPVSHRQEQGTTDNMEALRSQVKNLREELAETKERLAAVQAELTESEKLREEAEKSSRDLGEQVERLNKELLDLREASKPSVLDVACQMDPGGDVTSTEGATAGSTEPSDWAMEVGTSRTTQSVADSVRAVAEAAATRTGFVLDQTTGMYYDCNSGYYYDQVNKLYYDPNSGIYYYFDERSGSYQFHSQVELPASARARQERRGMGRGRISEMRKEKRRAEESRGDDNDRRRDSLNDMDCQIIETRQESWHRHKRRRRDVSKDHTRSPTDRDVGAGSQRVRWERYMIKERRAHVHGDAGTEVGMVTAGRIRKHERRMRSQERRRRQQEESRSRRKKDKSRRGDRRNKNGDHTYVSSQRDTQVMEVVSDGEIRTDEGMEPKGTEGDGGESRQNPKLADGRGNQATEKENDADEDDGEETSQDPRKEISNDGKQIGGPKNETSPETVRGSSEGSTARDDSHSGEEARTDEDKAGGQRSSEEAAGDKRVCQVIVRNPRTETRQKRTDEHSTKESLGDKGGQTQEYSDGEIVEDVTIVEDGEELIILSSDEMEEGELSDSISYVSSSEGSSFETGSWTSEEYLEEVSVDSDSSGGVEVLKVDYPPCIRMIVTKSDTLRPGSLYIVTCAGGTIGREGSSHILLIQSVKVSKRHAQIVYDSEERQYTIVDLGSQNGTLLNGKAISEQRVVSEPHPLNHRDYITIGGTTLRLHIHAGDETCDECEPGQVQALIALQQMNELSAGTTSGSRQDKEQQRRKELRHLKKKYNLAKEDHVAQDPSLMNPAYADRAGERRRTVGSDNPYQPDDQPASVNRAIDSTNVGHKLLSKMGWSEGQSLGKGDRGIKEPIQAVVHSKNAGLGSGMVQSVDQVQYSRRRNENWEKARGRYNIISPPQLGAVGRGKKAPMWVQGGVENLETRLREPSSDGRNVHSLGVVQLPLASWGKGERNQGTSQEIVEIWDESMETTSSTPQDDSGRTPTKKDTGKTTNSRAQSTGNDLPDKQGELRGNSRDYERLFLGKETSEANSEKRSTILQTVGSTSNDGKFPKGSNIKSRKKGTRQLRKGSEDIFPDRSETVESSERVDGNEQSTKTKSRNENEDDSTVEEVVKQNLEEVDSTSRASEEGSKRAPESSSERPDAVDKVNANSGLNLESVQAELDETSVPESSTAQKPAENHESCMEESRQEAGNSEILASQASQEASGSSQDRGKIQLKWTKGGKEKLATNLVAFEESESDGEQAETAANSSKNAQQEQATRQQRRGTRTGTRRGAGRPSRWSKAKTSGGN